MSARLLILLDAGNCMVACNAEGAKTVYRMVVFVDFGGKEFYCHCKSRINLWEMETCS